MDDAVTEENAPPPHPNVEGGHIIQTISSVRREIVFQDLFDHGIDGRLPHGVVARVAKTHRMSERTVARIWARGTDVDVENENKFADRRANNKRPPKYDLNVLKARLKNIPMEERGTIRASAASMDLPISTFYHYTKKKIFKSTRVAVKPTLSPTHCRNRIDFVQSRRDDDDPQFFDMQFNVIHIDEKWFYVDKVNRRCYLAEDEENLFTKQRNKKYMTKVMFLAAVARPRIDNNNDGWDFDGKIGVYPFVEYSEAKRSSRNRPAGDIEMKPINVTRDLFRSYIFEWLLPDIKKKCPAVMLENKIYIQMDNASPHAIDLSDVDIAEFGRICTDLEIDVEFRRQPAQSPDMNICDLCFFPSIQSLYFETVNMKTVEDIVAGVDEAFRLYDPQLLNRAFLSLFQNYNMCIINFGGNQYKSPHMAKEARERDNTLPVTILVAQAPVPDDGHFLGLSEEDILNQLDEAGCDDLFFPDADDKLVD
jgi:hypothetical protein